MEKSLPGQQNYFEAFIKVAQYLAGLTAQQDIWSETGRVLVNFFGADVGAVEERRANGEAGGRRWAFSERYSGQRDLEAETGGAIAEVLESGFLSARIIFTPDPLSIACFPITRQNQVVAVMVVGHGMPGPLPRELLNVYLAVAGLVGTIGERLASERELRRHRRQLEEEIAERKQAEAEIQRLNAELEQRVIERTAQLEAANQELEAFCYSVSHDLRAPLRHIDGYVDLLVSRCRDGLTDKGLHYVDTIAASARQMGVLIDDLLQFSRTGREEVRRESMDMNQALQDVLTILQESYAGRAIEWVIGELPSVRGDYALLRQVWANLLGNAVKFTQQREAARIEVSAREGEGEIIFAVADNGVGFDMRYAGKLFGVFQRLHSQEEFEGTGIGLATVRRIVTRHGGRVWAEAELNRGATFYFTLPIIKEENHA